MRIMNIYDEMFSTGGFEGVYDLPCKWQCYYPLFKRVLSIIKNKQYVNSILEVGCGTGAFAEIVLDRSSLLYKGFDFSEVSIEKARKRTGRTNLFFVADATDPLPYSYSKINYDCIVCTEVLEHIENDIRVVENWNKGLYYVFSVPNFDSKYHVRHFTCEEDVARRYERYLDIDEIIRIKKPCLSNISIRNYLRHLRWNRYHPERILNILGFGDFNKVGGWFIVSGRKNTK